MGSKGSSAGFSRLVQVGAEKDAAQCLTCIKLPSGLDTAAARRETNVHQNDIGAECGGTVNGFGRRRYRCTHLVIQFRHKHRKMHGEDGSVIFDDKNSHRSSCGEKWYRKLDGISRRVLSSFQLDDDNTTGKPGKGLRVRSADANVRRIVWGAGVLFGLTEITSDVVLKWTLGVEF
jgi:hypothetical protein